MEEVTELKAFLKGDKIWEKRDVSLWIRTKTIGDSKSRQRDFFGEGGKTFQVVEENFLPFLVNFLCFPHEVLFFRFACYLIRNT